MARFFWHREREEGGRIFGDTMTRGESVVLNRIGSRMWRATSMPC